MVSKYFSALLLFVLCNMQAMEIAKSSKASFSVEMEEDENEYVTCMASAMILFNKEYPYKHCQVVARQNWKNNEIEREKFKDIVAQPRCITYCDGDVVGNQFIADMVPRMRVFSQEEISTKDCEMLARLLWQKDAELRMKYQKSLKHITLDNLSENELNIIGSCIERVGKDTLRGVNEVLNEKIILQNEYECCYQELDNFFEVVSKLDQWLQYTTMFNPAQELLKIIDDSNANIRLIQHCIRSAKRYMELVRYYSDLRDRYVDHGTLFQNVQVITFNEILYWCINMAMSQNSKDVLKVLIAAEIKPNNLGRHKEISLMLYAKRKNNIPMMRILDEYGGNINGIDKRIPLLQYVVQKEKIEEKDVKKEKQQLEQKKLITRKRTKKLNKVHPIVSKEKAVKLDEKNKSIDTSVIKEQSPLMQMYTTLNSMGESHGDRMIVMVIEELVKRGKGKEVVEILTEVKEEKQQEVKQKKLDIELDTKLKMKDEVSSSGCPNCQIF